MSERESLDLRFWNPREFALEQSDGTLVDWWPNMSLRLLVCLDVFRQRWGKACRISPVPGALGRNQGRDSRSQHNVDRWGEVRAADIFPTGLRTAADAKHAIRCATEAGFTGVGVYPHWQPHPGLHLDVRTDELPGDPATWGRITDGSEQVYVAHTIALRHFPGGST